MSQASNHLHKRGRFGAPALVLLALALFTTPDTYAETVNVPNTQQVAAYEAAAEPDRVKLLIFLAKNGSADQVEWLMQRYPLQGSHATNRTLYLEGLILRSRRNYTGAAEKFRAALADDPKLTLVRADLAQTLVILEQDDSALYHLKQLAADAPTEAEAKGVRSFMEQIDERSPFKRNFWIAAAPTSNVNYGSRNPLLGTTANGLEATTAKPIKAIGVAAGGSVGFSKRLGNDYSIVAGLGLQGTIYEDQTYSSASLGESLEIRRLFDRGYVGLGLMASQGLDVEGRALASYSFGPRASLRMNLTPRTAIAGTAQYEWREQDDQLNAGSDGTAWTVSGDITHYLSPGFSVTALGSYSDVDVDWDFKSYDTITGGLAVHKEMPWGITADVYASLARSEFDGPMFIPMIGPMLREDWRATGKIELTKRDFNIMGFAPALSYTYTYNESTVQVYDFDNHAIDLRFTKDF